jgi:hypothetical protein
MVQSSSSYDLASTNSAYVFRDLPVGIKVKLTNGAIAEITGNPHDGAWLLIRYVEHPEDPSQVGKDDMVFFIDVEATV